MRSSSRGSGRAVHTTRCRRRVRIDGYVTRCTWDGPSRCSGRRISPAIASRSRWSRRRTWCSPFPGKSARSCGRSATSTSAISGRCAGGSSRSSIEAGVVVEPGGHRAARRRTLLDEYHRVLRRDVELLAARLARDRIVDTDHVVAELAVQRAIAIVGAVGQAILLRPDHPAHLVVVGALAAGTGELVGPRLVAVVEEVAFVQRHPSIIALVARSGTHRPGRYNWPWRTKAPVATPANCRCLRCGRPSCFR